MKIYAINWVMGSYIDSHIKKIFAQNTSVELAGFIFPKALVPRVNGVPVYTVETAPVDASALYVDFSNYQVLPEAVSSWLSLHRLKTCDITGWLRALAESEAPVLIDGMRLSDLARLQVSPRTLARVDYLSGDMLRRSIAAYRSLNLRTLHDNACEPYEGYLQKNLRAIANATPNGHIRIRIDSDDLFEYELSRSVFSMKEFASLSISLNGATVYEIQGRSPESALTRIVVTRSTGLTRLAAEVAQGGLFVVIRLDRGLLDLDRAVDWVTASCPDASTRFDQISSTLRDAFLVVSA